MNDFFHLFLLQVPVTQAGCPIEKAKKALYNTKKSCHMFHRQTVSELREGIVPMWVQSQPAYRRL